MCARIFPLAFRIPTEFDFSPFFLKNFSWMESTWGIFFLKKVWHQVYTLQKDVYDRCFKENDFSCDWMLISTTGESSVSTKFKSSVVLYLKFFFLTWQAHIFYCL